MSTASYCDDRDRFVSDVKMCDICDQFVIDVDRCRSLWNPNAGRYENYKRCDNLRREDNNIHFADSF